MDFVVILIRVLVEVAVVFLVGGTVFATQKSGWVARGVCSLFFAIAFCLLPATVAVTRQFYLRESIILFLLLASVFVFFLQSIDYRWAYSDESAGIWGGIMSGLLVVCVAGIVIWNVKSASHENIKDKRALYEDMATTGRQTSSALYKNVKNSDDVKKLNSNGIYNFLPHIIEYYVCVLVLLSNTLFSDSGEDKDVAGY